MDFEEILNIAGFKAPKLVLDGTNWKIWQAKINSQYVEHTSFFIFFNSRASWGNAEEAREKFYEHKIAVDNEFILIIQNSAKLPTDQFRWKTYFPQLQSVYSVREFLRKQFESKERITAGYTPSYFVELDVKKVGENKKINAVSAILDWLKDRDSKRPSIAVLIGRPGGGKTTLAHYLYQAEGIPKGTLPLLIRSDQWQKFDPSAPISLNDIWKEAAALSNIDQREIAIKIYIKNGVLFPLFDGFDELCSLRSNQFSPNEVIEQLLELTTKEKEGGKILLTSRDVFWKEMIDKKFNSQIEVFELQPFNKPQLMQYLEKRFSGHRSGMREKSLELIREYQKIAYAPLDSYPPTDSRLGNVPVVVEMIANYVSEGGDKYGIEGNDPIYGILKMLCHREQIRQKIETDEDKQIGIFKELAVSSGDKFSEKELEEWAVIYSDEFNNSAKVQALHSHPFITKNNEFFTFRYGFLPMYFQALYTFDKLNNSDSCDKQIVKIFEVYGNGTEAYFDYLAEFILRHFTIDAIFDYEKAKNFLYRCIEKLNKRGDWHNVIPSAIIHLILKIIDKNRRDFEKEQRTRELLSFLKTPYFKKLKFTGIFNKLNFSGIRFDNCIFTDAGFTNCNFDENTSFKDCNFQGDIRFNNCSGVGSLKIDDTKNTINPKTRDFLVDVITSMKITPEQLLRWITMFLKRFKNGVYFVKLGHDQLFTGINVPKLSQETFLKLFIENKILESEKGFAGPDLLYQVNPAPQVRDELISFLENGIQGIQIKKVYEELKKGFK